jgi:hypothetical protein
MRFCSTRGRWWARKDVDALMWEARVTLCEMGSAEPVSIAYIHYAQRNKDDYDGDNERKDQVP